MKVLILLNLSFTFCTALKVRKYQKSLLESYEILEEHKEAKSEMQCCSLCSNTIGCEGIKFEDSQCSLLKNTRKGTLNGNCWVNCSLTVDNELLSVSLNDQQLTVHGDHQNIRNVKTFSFNSCKSGSLIVKGRDQNDENHCAMARLILHCTASDIRNPWHNFVSGKSHWKASHGQTVCARGGGILNYDMPLMNNVKELGGKKIWAEDTKTVTLIGTPSSIWINNEMISSNEDGLAEDPTAALGSLQV